MKGLFGALALPTKHLQSKHYSLLVVYTLNNNLIVVYLFTAIVIFSMLTIVITALILFVATLKPSISVFRIVIITLGSTMIGSVLLCLTSGYIRSHSNRKFTFPLPPESKLAHDLCKKPISPDEMFANSNHLLNVVAIAE